MNRETLHYLPAMAFDGLYAQLETDRDLPRAVALCHHTQDFDLSRRQLVEWTAQLEGLGDRIRGSQ